MEKEQESSVSVIDKTLISSDPTPAETPATPVYNDHPTSTSTPDPSVSTSLSITPSMKSLESSFSQKSTRARSLKRAAEALPKSPRKKREVLETLATNVLKIKVPSVFQKKRGRPTKEISQEEENWLDNFFERPDVTRHSPKRKDNVYVGKIEGERRYLQVRYLLCTIREVQCIANTRESEGVESSFFETFQKELTFRQVYTYLKKHKEIKWNRNVPHESCTCEICENIKLFVRSLNQHINQKIPEDERKIAETYSCSKENRNIVVILEIVLSVQRLKFVFAVPMEVAAKRQLLMETKILCYQLF